MATNLAVPQVLADPVEAAVQQLIAHVGEDPFREGLERTPYRVAKAFREMTAGYQQNPAEILATTFAVGVAYDELILLRGVRFTSLCEHHMLPFTGTVDVGYLPKARVAGLSKLARLVACYSRRLQVQERMTSQIAEALMQHLDAAGAGVVVRAKHACMGHRGALQPDAEMVTSSMLGLLRTEPAARDEFLRLIG